MRSELREIQQLPQNLRKLISDLQEKGARGQELRGPTDSPDQKVFLTHAHLTLPYPVCSPFGVTCLDRPVLS